MSWSKTIKRRESREASLFPEPGVEPHGLVWSCLPGRCGDVTVSMESEAEDWVVLLHDEGVLELGNVDVFMAEFRN